MSDTSDEHTERAKLAKLFRWTLASLSLVTRAAGAANSRSWWTLLNLEEGAYDSYCVLSEPQMAQHVVQKSAEREPGTDR